MRQQKYQVFLSSTYSDLKAERDSITRALYELDCIPVGMEAFPAADEEQFEFIKRLIDQTDYYVLLLGGRYGTISPDGYSYTEKEYRYAKEIGVPILAFVHSSPQNLQGANSDLNDPKKAESFYRFRNEITEGRMVKMWNDPTSLSAPVVLALNRAFQSKPRRGWIRTPEFDSGEILNELHKTQAALREAEQKLSHFSPENFLGDDVAGLDVLLDLEIETWSHNHQGSVVRGVNRNYQVSLEEVLVDIGPNMIESLNQDSFSNMVALQVSEGDRYSSAVEYKYALTRKTLNKLRIQLEALGLVEVFRSKTLSGGVSNFWKLTNLGINEVRKRAVIRSQTRTTD